jgi:hypothetical protein
VASGESIHEIRSQGTSLPLRNMNEHDPTDLLPLAYPCTVLRFRCSEGYRSPLPIESDKNLVFVSQTMKPVRVGGRYGGEHEEGIADEVLDRLLEGEDPSTVFETGGLLTT